MQPLIDGEPGGVVDVLDRGLAYGDGVFRTLRVATGTIRSWARHYRKLASDCRALGMAWSQYGGVVHRRGCILRCRGSSI